MASVGIAGEVCVVLEQIDLAANTFLLESLFCLDHQFFEDSFSCLVLTYEIPNAVAFGSRVLGV